MNIVVTQSGFCRCYALRSLLSAPRSSVNYTVIKSRAIKCHLKQVRYFVRPTQSQSYKRLDHGDRITLQRYPSKPSQTESRDVLSQNFRGTRHLAIENGTNLKISLLLPKVRADIAKTATLKHLGVSSTDLNLRWEEFVRKFDDSNDESKDGSETDTQVQKITNHYRSNGHSGLQEELYNAFLQHILTKHLGVHERGAFTELLPCEHPIEWYPRARKAQRRIHVHIGPTNSGKTYQALKRLEKAKTGVYAGPLRLLAHEVYMRLNAKGQQCSLVTGDDRRRADDSLFQSDVTSPKLSCTVEMTPLDKEFEVAVIDEIQMVADDSRGWAWTQAFLGLDAEEVHVCGEERALQIIKVLSAYCGDEVIVHRYKRLSPLAMMDRSLGGNIRELKKGDCIVAFSIMVIHAMRQLIEKNTGKKCAIIYGGLPAETRAQQAKLFNSADNDYDFLVASNAIGMGLNLNIKRLIFQSSVRMANNTIMPIENTELVQIAGRAGRFSTASQDIEASGSKKPLAADKLHRNTSDKKRISAQNTGLVTTLENFDFPTVAAAMNSTPEPIKMVGILPSNALVTRFAQHYPSGTPFSFILSRVFAQTPLSRHYFLCDMDTQIGIAKAIDSIQDITVSDRLIFCAAPVSTDRAEELRFLRALAWKVAKSEECTILDFPELELELLEDEYTPNQKYLRGLEALNRMLVVFAWVSYRFVGVFTQVELAQHVRRLVETRINSTLSQTTLDYSKMRERRKAVEENRQAQEAGVEGEVQDIIERTEEHLFEDDDQIQHRKRSANERSRRRPHDHGVKERVYEKGRHAKNRERKEIQREERRNRRGEGRGGETRRKETSLTASVRRRRD